MTDNPSHSDVLSVGITSFNYAREEPKTNIDITVILLLTLVIKLTAPTGCLLNNTFLVNVHSIPTSVDDPTI